MVGVDQHVDDLAQCTVGRQTAVIKQMVEAAEIITYACDRLGLVISPRSTTCCSDVKTETLLRRGLLELGIPFVVTRRTRELGVDTGGGARRAVGVMRKRLCNAAKGITRLGIIRRHTQKMSSLHSTNIWPAWGGGHGHRTLHNPMHQIARCGLRLLQGQQVCHVWQCHLFAPQCGPAVQAGIECIKQWLVFWAQPL